ncbi:unnamed protein product [Boreogadus saida]
MIARSALSDAWPSAELELHQRAPALPEQGASGRRGGPAIDTKGMSQCLANVPANDASPVYTYPGRASGPEEPGKINCRLSNSPGCQE